MTFILLILGVCGPAIWIVWVVLSEVKRRNLIKLIKFEYPENEIKEFEGCYVRHWEVGRFEWNFNGMKPKWGNGLFCELKWECDFPKPLTPIAGSNRRRMRLKFLGKRIESGRFGHRGMCDHRVTVILVIETYNDENI